jgi:hypothetical protein
MAFSIRLKSFMGDFFRLAGMPHYACIEEGPSKGWGKIPSLYGLERPSDEAGPSAFENRR